MFYEVSIISAPVIYSILHQICLRKQPQKINWHRFEGKFAKLSLASESEIFVIKKKTKQKDKQLTSFNSKLCKDSQHAIMYNSNTLRGVCFHVDYL